jgi:membrane-associated phospholipid phosphatase
MKKQRADYILIGLFLISVAAIYAGIVFLDREIALLVEDLMHSNLFLDDATSNIPDVLLQLVCIGSAAMWIAYYYLVRRKGRSVHTEFLQIAAISLPFAYLLKSILKIIFGRINTRVWLQTGGSMNFHWFSGLENNGGFPSGHMTVFAAFFVAVWLYYPNYRRISAAALSLLGMALIVTNYHFLSDVVVGFYAGLLVIFVLRYCLTKVAGPCPPPLKRYCGENEIQ